MSLQAIFGVVTSLVVGVAVAFGIYAVVSQNRPYQYPESSSSGRSQPRPSGGRRSSRFRKQGAATSQWQGYSSDDDVVCSICMEKIDEGDGADSRPIKLRCGHLFHDNCIAPWVPNQKCPNCREQM